MRIGIPLAIVLLAFSAGATTARTPTGAIRGFVPDASGAVVPAVDVELAKASTGHSRHTVGRKEGRFEFPFVPVGPYHLEAILSDRRTVVRDFTLQGDPTQRVDIRMEVAAASESVEVVGTVSPVEATRLSNQPFYIPGQSIHLRARVEEPTTATAHRYLRRHQPRRLRQPDPLVRVGTFGRISATRTIRGDAGSSRQMQFGWKFYL